MPQHILTLSCPDRIGIVHAVSGFLVQHNANIDEAAQFSDPDTRLFFMRVTFDCALSTAEIDRLFNPLAQTLGMRHALHPAMTRMPTVIMVSREGHCLNDLLYRAHNQTLSIDVRAVIGNHPDLAKIASHYSIPFHHVPIDDKSQAEMRQIELIRGAQAELVVLARYMQILSTTMCEQLRGRAINIHHSFLPSFKGARPYHQAHARGVKLIGATAHYVTGDLDEGPIIEQDVARVDQAATPEQWVALGKDTENQVLARAVKWHSEHRVLLNGHKTVIFK
jgi:formyltetrahydrofolate deformylase